MYSEVLVILILSASATCFDKLIHKCCDVYEMLASDGRSCVESPWPRNYSFLHDVSNPDVIIPPFNNEWLNYWMPPGLPPDKISAIFLLFLEKIEPQQLIQSADASAIWEQRLAHKHGGKQHIFFFEGYDQIITGEESYDYCVDAAKAPLGPFGLLKKYYYRDRDYICKCCGSHEVLEVENGMWACRNESRGTWSRYNSSFLQPFESEYPFTIIYSENRLTKENLLECVEGKPKNIELIPGVEQMANLARRTHNLYFSSWEMCLDYRRHNDGALNETLIFCEYSRITRGVYWTLRPLSFASVLLLLTALVAITTNRRMRLTAHGWSLACHATCLVGFNLGQVFYYLSVSDIIDDNGAIPENVQSICTSLAFSMYFLLTAAACWLTAVCVNMALGFRKLKVARSGGSDKKKFLALSSGAWGLPTVLTSVCASIFYSSSGAALGYFFSVDWYMPRLAETRTCFGEDAFSGGQESSVKSGTALFFYGPMGGLVLVNAVFLWKTLQQVQFLKRGNSVLRREEDMRAREQKRTVQSEGSPEAVNTGGKTAEGRGGGGSSAAVDVKNIRLYLKMLLMTGGTEILTEVIAWSLTVGSRKSSYSHLDYSMVYRATGYVTDFFKAVCVAWLASPEEGYLAALRKRLLGEKQGRGPAPATPLTAGAGRCRRNASQAVTAV